MLDIDMLLQDLSNEDLLATLRSLVGNGRRLVTEVISYLVEVEERRLHLDLACSSMFDFCRRQLGLSEGETFRRLTVARMARRFPQLLVAIADGRLSLSNVILLRDLVTDENIDALIDAASGKSKREVEELVAMLAPNPDVAASIRRLADGVSPLSEDRYRVTFTASGRVRDKIEQARSLLRHVNPSGELSIVFERALDALIVRLEKTQQGKTESPKTSNSPAGSGHVTRSTRRTVMARDGQQCSYVNADGERCPSHDFLELDHLRPRAAGGGDGVENMRVLCRAHNRHAAEQVFGREHVAERIEQRQTRTRVERALVTMGFRRQEALRATAEMDAGSWCRPIDVLVREALASLS